MSDVLAAAHAYVKRGWRVIPLHRTGEAKRPLWNDWHHKGLTSGGDVQAIWENDPAPNIGIVTGQGILGVDLDSYKAPGCRAALEAAIGEPLPDTWHSITGRGGEHLVYTYDPAEHFGNGGPGVPGVDVRGDGGYLVAPPSVSAYGPYKVLDDRDPVPAPEGLRKLLRGRRTAEAADAVPGEPLDVSMMLPAGMVAMLAERVPPDVDKSDWFHKLVGDLRRLDVPQGQVVTLLTPWCVTNLPRFVGRVAEEVARCWAKVDPPIHEGVISPPQPPLPAQGGVAGRVVCADLLAGLRTGSWLDVQSFPVLRYAVPGVLPEGAVLLVGPPKIGKSWFVLSAGLAIASGGTMLGQPTGEPRAVLLLALEDGDRRLQDRCRTLLGDTPIPDRFSYLTRCEAGDLDATVALWLDRHGGDAPLVILDTLGKVMPPTRPGESSYQRDYRVASALKRIADDHPGMTLLVNHHDRKAASDDFVDAVSGTHGLAGAADTIVVLTRKRNEEAGILRVTGRDVAEGQYALTLTGGSHWQLDGEHLEDAAARAAMLEAAHSLGDQSVNIVATVSTFPEGATAKLVAEAAGLDPEVCKVYLNRLEKAGRIERWSRGVYGFRRTFAQ